MKIKVTLVKTVAIALTVAYPMTGVAQFGALGGIAKKAVGGGGEAADGAGFLKQLTPGAVKFAKAYALYYEALGNTEGATKLKVAAEQLEKGGAVSKDQQGLLDKSRKEIAKIANSKPLDEAAIAKWKEANAMYTQGLGEWGVVSGLVSAALASDPKAALTNPELGLAATMCVKGLKDLSGFIEISRATTNENNEQKKAAQ
ncbi:MAG: hypothetical protein RIS24_1532 [Verrucomicrobiota bacterium]